MEVINHKKVDSSTGPIFEPLPGFALTLGGITYSLNDLQLLSSMNLEMKEELTELKSAYANQEIELRRVQAELLRKNRQLKELTAQLSGYSEMNKKE